MNPTNPVPNGPNCPIPIGSYTEIVMAHGGGGRLTHQLIEKLFRGAFDNPALAQQHDGACLEVDGLRLAFTTDSFVVRPLFFPGGNIGSLAVNGTVNDLAMCGARPLWLSAGFILEEGLPLATLKRVVEAMAQAARQAQIELVTGDTKVVDKGKGDAIYINTAGIGIVEGAVAPCPQQVRPGDVVLVSGDVGRHGIAIMSVREGLDFESPIESDCAPLYAPVAALLEANLEVRCLRDLTRGGLATSLNEIAVTAQVQIDIDESAVPVREEVRGACEILGLDPLYVANEGRFVAFVAAADADRALEILRRHPVSTGAARIGQVRPCADAPVTMRSTIGARRILDMLSGEQLPRIC
jgi:hydrogenase expression/formation protein HypE